MEVINLKATPAQVEKAKENAQYIHTILKGTVNTEQVSANSHRIEMSQRAAIFFSWGPNKFYYINAMSGNDGLQFSVQGRKFKGRVRVWYNYATDTFDVEFLRPKKDELVERYEDVYVDSLQEVIDHFVEK